jgi:glycosyltransferase involved in cell wall biosynthesis
MACPNYWTSPFQVGSQHLARAFVRAGWEVAYVSDPVTPWHLGRGLTRELRERLALWLGGGKSEHGGRLWAYVPGAWIAGHNQPLLRCEAVHRHWHRWTAPNVTRLVKERGFGKVDLLYVDSISQSFWLDVVEHRQAVYRLTDFSPNHGKFTQAARRLEQEMARRVDVVAYPSRELRGYAEGLGAQRTFYMANGVEYRHFADVDVPPPREYAALRGPVAVYVGKIVPWFHFAWIRHAARALPEFSFVLIGQPELARRELGGLGNVHVLGYRDYATLPAYLQHADVGIIPFDAAREADTVECLNPCKLYQYFAAGLPVVTSGWASMLRLSTPARVCGGADEFVGALRQAAAEPRQSDHYRQFAHRFDWQAQLEALLARLEVIDGESKVLPFTARPRPEWLRVVDRGAAVRRLCKPRWETLPREVAEAAQETGLALAVA